MWGTFFGVAFAILAWAGLPLVDRFGLPALFLAHAVYMAAFALLLGATLKPLVPTAPFPPLALRQLLRDNGAIYRSPRISAPAAGWLFYTFCFVALLTVLPPFIAPGQRALVLGAMPLASMAVSLTLGVALLRVMSAVRVIEIGFAASALLALLLLAVPGSPLVCILLASAMGLIQGASFAAVPQLNDRPADQAQANGAMAQAGNIGNTLGTPVMAATVAGLGYAGLILLASLAFVFGLIVHLGLAGLRREQ